MVLIKQTLGSTFSLRKQKREDSGCPSLLPQEFPGCSARRRNPNTELREESGELGRPRWEVGRISKGRILGRRKVHKDEKTRDLQRILNASV